MKKLLLIASLIIFLASCSAASQPGFNFVNGMALLVVIIFVIIMFLTWKGKGVHK